MTFTPHPLPEPAARLLAEVGAPARLVAHLELVHDVAVRLLDRLADACPDLAVDREAVLFGAATHDIGKALHRHELTGPGSAHEPDGHRLLREHGVAERLARFARTHADWHAPGIGVEDLLVGLADKIWKARRAADLENLVAARIAAASGRERWAAFLILDDILDALAADADARLAYQNAHPVD
ncbi:HD domain-containing protein [Thermomonospora cellulosilytica]|uniref:HD superfamily phosphodiesterase n=1 Tax=Thermomonospora cellulosilytica TaxID=1411118 RepID=A0A7W3RB30_9ACTN|nr:HD domain-containing protein [Thermomonospora cellulosilytica]MBA9006527.1 HD superfamily phosphodiesterase [Thermomonospora cellulosilytica]